MEGKAYLVGAGPGDPDLITLKAKEVIQEAEVIMYDSLVGDEIIEWLAGHLPDVELIDCGKRKGEHKLTQQEINQLLLAKAKEGKTVVRLKGGDPFVFGRGGEELEFLRLNGISCQVIPGITSAIAAPSYAGIPVTHRGLASSVTFITGHEDPTKEDSDLNWECLAKIGGTLVVLMGVTKMEEIAGMLMNKGMDPTTPAAVIEGATLTDQRVITGKLNSIAKQAMKEKVKPPAVMVIGKVVTLTYKEEC